MESLPAPDLSLRAKGKKAEIPRLACRDSPKRPAEGIARMGESDPLARERPQAYPARRL